MRSDLWEYPWKFNCSCEKGFDLINNRRCEGIVTILLMFLQMISTGAWISKVWWNVAIKINWQRGQGSTGWIFSCSFTRFEVTFTTLGLVCSSYPTLSFSRIVPEVLLFFSRLEAEIFLWLLLDYREKYSLLLHLDRFYCILQIFNMQFKNILWNKSQPGYVLVIFLEVQKFSVESIIWKKMR